MTVRILMAKKLKACLYVDSCGGTPSENRSSARTAYEAMVEWLTLFVASCDVLTDIRPFQLGYRSFDIYLVDTGGCNITHKLNFMRELGGLVRARSSRIYLFWTGESWEAFKLANPDLENNPRCINCCDLDVFEKISEILLDREGGTC
jgi:hypothetical protein